MLSIKPRIDGGAKSIAMPYWDTGLAVPEWSTELGLPFAQTPGVEEVDFLANDPTDLDALFETLFGTLRIAVIHSGDKERPGSVLYRTANTRPWKSYREVAVDIQETLYEIGFEHVLLVPDDMAMIDTLRRQEIQLAWLNTGGVQGENSVCHAAAVLEMVGIPYVGHGPLHASILDEKDAFKRHLQAMGILTSPFVTWQPSNAASFRRRMEQTFGDYAGPFVVKPVSGRASLHVHCVQGREQIPALAEEIHSTTRKGVLIEKYLNGREYCVAVCGGLTRRRDRFHFSTSPFAFSTLERHFQPGEAIFTSMDKKAIGDDRASLLPENEAQLRLELIDLARRIYREFDLKSIVRIDVRADAEGRLHVLEANPKPDLKRPSDGRTSLVSMGLAEQGMDYTDLIYGLLADRIYDLFRSNPSKVEHILAPAVA